MSMTAPARDHSHQKIRRTRRNLLGWLALVLLALSAALRVPIRNALGGLIYGSRTAATLSESVGTVIWHACDAGIEGTDCGYIIVPKDYFDPDAGTAKIAFGRYKSKVKSSKGTVFFNPGGPGNSGKAWITKLNPYLISNAIGEDFDVVGFDPRGVGDSVPRIKCFLDETTGSYESFIKNTVLERGFDIASNMSIEEIRNILIIKEAEADALLRTQFEVCQYMMGEELRYTGTTTVVRDIDFMSKLFDGEDALINFYGLSYGAVLGLYLVNMLPDRVGRVAIDGVEDTLLWATQPAYRFHRQWLTDTDRTYDHFFQECAKAGPSGCALATVQREDPSAINSRLEEFIDHLSYQPISSPKSKHPGVLTTGRAMKFLLNALYRPVTWPLTATVFANAMRGDPSLLLDLNEPTSNCDLSRTAVACNDQPLFKAPTIEEMVDERLYVYQNVSRFAFAAENVEYVDFGCQYWPAMPPEKFQGPWNHTLQNPILVLSNTLDPITPVLSGQTVAELLGSSARLLIMDGPGHTTIALPSLCVKTHLNAFFANGTLPPEGTVCPTSAGPFPSPDEDGELIREL